MDPTRNCTLLTFSLPTEFVLPLGLNEEDLRWHRPIRRPEFTAPDKAKRFLWYDQKANLNYESRFCIRPNRRTVHVWDLFKKCIHLEV